jgi:hypothetical protein
MPLVSFVGNAISFICSVAAFNNLSRGARAVVKVLPAAVQMIT